jgi:anti-anti-sigma factor
MATDLEEGLVVQTTAFGGGFVVEVAGEIDLSTAPGLETRLTTAINYATAVLVVDLEAVTFMDAAGLTALLRANKCAQAARMRLVLQRPPPICRRLVGIAGLESMLEMRD